MSAPIPPETPETPDGGLYTVETANRLLPYVRDALRRATTCAAAMESAARGMRNMEAVGHTPTGELILAADHAAARRELTAYQAELRRILRQLGRRQCLVKDLALGLCDFPAVIAGQRVLLCWQLDEPSVAHYHGEDEGYSGRRPIPPGTP